MQATGAISTLAFAPSNNELDKSML